MHARRLSGRREGPRGRREPRQGGESIASVKRCFGRWRVEVSRGLLEQLESENPALAERLKKLVEEMAASLNTDSQAILRLLREPIVARIEDVPLRRYRLGDYRFYYVVDAENCRVVFLDLEVSYHRGRTYRDLRRRRRLR